MVITQYIIVTWCLHGCYMVTVHGYYTSILVFHSGFEGSCIKPPPTFYLSLLPLLLTHLQDSSSLIQFVTRGNVRVDGRAMEVPEGLSEDTSVRTSLTQMYYCKALYSMCDPISMFEGIGFSM